MEGEREVLLFGPAGAGALMVVDAVDYLLEQFIAVSGGQIRVVGVEDVTDSGCEAGPGVVFMLSLVDLLPDGGMVCGEAFALGGQFGLTREENLSGIGAVLDKLKGAAQACVKVGELLLDLGEGVPLGGQVRCGRGANFDLRQKGTERLQHKPLQLIGVMCDSGTAAGCALDLRLAAGTGLRAALHTLAAAVADNQAGQRVALLPIAGRADSGVFTETRLHLIPHSAVNDRLMQALIQFTGLYTRPGKL